MPCDANGINIQNQHQKYLEKSSNMWKLSNIFPIKVWMKMSYLTLEK